MLKQYGNQCFFAIVAYLLQDMCGTKTDEYKLTSEFEKSNTTKTVKVKANGKVKTKINSPDVAENGASMTVAGFKDYLASKFDVKKDISSTDITEAIKNGHPVMSTINIEDLGKHAIVIVGIEVNDDDSPLDDPFLYYMDPAEGIIQSIKLSDFVEQKPVYLVEILKCQ